MSVFNKKYLPGSVLRCPTAAENGFMTKGVVYGGGLTSLRLRRISSPSQTLRRRLVRTTDDGRRGECSTLAAVRRGFVFHTSRLVRWTTVWTCMQRSQILIQNRVFCLPHLHPTPRLGGCRRNIAISFGMVKLEWLGYPVVKKIRRYLYLF